MLRDLAIRDSADARLVVEHERRRTGGALIQREDERQEAVPRTACSGTDVIDVVLNRRMGSISSR